MTQEFEDMLYLLGWNYKSMLKDNGYKFNIEKIREFSISQGVWTLVFPELEKYADTSLYYNEFLANVLINIKEKAFHLKVISDMNKSGYKVCLLKGAAVAVAYPNPSYRISGDTDILIDPSHEQEIIDFLKERGYTIKPRGKKGHHFKAYHSAAGLLEVHVRLYSITTEDILLDGQNLYNENWTTESIEGYNIPVLGLNDGLIYLTAHYIKHLVNEGGGIRQMLDLLLYIEKYRDKLDFDRYNRLLKELRYDRLIDVIKTIGAKYWGFDYPIKDEELADEILTDSEEGGIFGFDSHSRDGFYTAYCGRRSKNVLSGTASWVMNNERGLKNTFFPSQASLLNQTEYQYAKHKILVPVAWIHRYFVLFKKKILRKKGEENSVINKRMQMMQRLNMI